ncbi:DUF58 domain-containing protein [Actinomadura rugatobispora]|uniref:DUF58 domain-containing protein n=1 Tax=Actinomadura rugatobispora TaxID=1994 RepID=A0ABW1AED9_9ACTN|nr:hypothetical protein GCM10010200_033910 [Actinomadura rugatobispora]
MAAGSPRPTARGWGLLAAGAGLCGGGLGFGYLAPAVLGALALPAVAAGLLLAGRSRPVDVRRRCPAVRARAGEPVTITLALDRPRPSEVVERVAGPDGEAVISLGTARARMRYEVAAGRRGVVKAGPLRLVRTDPLGLARTSCPADDVPVRVLVHPRHHPLAAVPAGGTGGRDTSTAATRASEGAFAGLRDHAPGDDVRQVHWRTSARRGRLVVREQADAVQAGVTVLVDDRHGPAELDELAEVAASIVEHHPAVPVELRLASGALSPATASRTAHLDLLAEAGALPGADFAAACGRLRTGSGRVVVLLPGAAEEDVPTALAALTGRTALSLVGVLGTASGVEPPRGVRLLEAPDAAAFTERWNRTRWWAR